MPTNPLCDLISTLTHFIDAIQNVHQAQTEEERTRALNAWDEIRKGFWPRFQFPSEAFLQLSCQAIAWCRPIGCPDAEDVATIEGGAHFLVELAKLVAPCANPEIYANKDEAFKQWNTEGEFLLNAIRAREQLRRLSARMGVVWSNSPDVRSSSQTPRSANAADGAPTVPPSRFPLSDNPFLELHYFARSACDAEVSDLCWSGSAGRPFPHPITTDRRREEQLERWQELASSALHCAKEVGIPLLELEERLSAYSEAVLDVMQKRDTTESTEQVTRFSSPWYGCEQRGGWQAAIAACREFYRRMQTLQEASQRLARLAEYHAQGKLPQATGTGRLPPSWADLFERVGNHFAQLPTTETLPSESAADSQSQGDATNIDRDQGELEQAEGNGCPQEKQADALSPLQYDILDALRSLKAFDPDKRAAGPDIAAKVGGDANGQSVKAPLAELKRRGLVDSRTGRSGGSWLTEAGLNLINLLRPKH
jgi:hypothetical protein